MAERESDQAIKDRQVAELEAERQERRTRLGHVGETEVEDKPKRGRPKGSKAKAEQEETKEAESEA